MERLARLPKSELEVARIGWDSGKATVREVVDALPDDRGLDFFTVQTYLRRLTDKGYLEVRRQGEPMSTPRWQWLLAIVLAAIVLPGGGSAQQAASQSDVPKAKPASPDLKSTIESPQLLYLTWQKDGNRSTGKPIPHTLWGLDGKVVIDRVADDVLKKAGSLSVAWRQKDELHPLVLIFRIDPRLTYCPVQPVVITAGGEISHGMTARSRPTNGMNVSAAVPRIDTLPEWPKQISLDIRYPVENITTIKTLAGVPDDPVAIAPGVRWYLDSTRALERKEGESPLRRADGKTAAVLETSRDLADPLVSYSVRVYLRGVAAPLSSLYSTIIEPNGKLHEIDVSEAFVDKNAVARVEITRQRYKARRIDNVPVRVDLLPETDDARQR